MPFMYPLTDAHVHPDFSIDAKGSIEEFCERALSIGLHEMIFTTHVDVDKRYPKEYFMVVNGERVPTDIDSIMRYAEAVWEAREKYYDLGVMVKCGVEIDFFPELDTEFLKIFEDRLFEYRLAGVHRVGNLSFSYKGETEELYRRYDVPGLLEKYYTLVSQAAQFGIFDAVAHLDYYRRFAPENRREEVKKTDYDFIDEALASLVDNAVSIEVNTSALRHGHRDYYPGIKLLNKARSAGVQIRYLGSDAHCPDQLALDFETAEMIVYETNVWDPHEG